MKNRRSRNDDFDFMMDGPMGMQMNFQNFIWITDFDSDSLGRFYDAFMRLELDERIGLIPIMICSHGGEADALFAMRDIIKTSSKPVATIALGTAMSCGACLLAAGSKGLRFAGPNTTIMIHEVSSGAVGKTADIQISADLAVSYNSRMLTHLSEDTGHSLEDLETILTKRKNTDWYLSAKEAKKFGLIDNIEVPRIVGQPPQLALATLPHADNQMEEPTKKKAGRPPKKANTEKEE